MKFRSNGTLPRRTMVKLLGATAAVGASSIARRASAVETFKFGTLAPKASPWGQVFSTWERAVKERSGGALELQLFYNGQQGDEAAMVSKIKSGQLDGAAVTAVGLSKIYKPILALQIPGLFRTWAKLDAARDAMKGEFEKGVSDAGFFLNGWGDVGAARILSKGFAIRTPDDLKGKKPYMWRDDGIAPALYQAIGGVTPVPLNVPEVLPHLNTGAINVLNTASLAAEQLQWASKLDHITDVVTAMNIGALVFSRRRIDGLPADLRTILVDTGTIAAAALTKRIRSEDDAAFARLKGKMTFISPTADELNKWNGVFAQVQQRLVQSTTFSADLMSKMQGLAK